jgi:hypothetical protein
MLTDLALNGFSDLLRLGISCFQHAESASDIIEIFSIASSQPLRVIRSDPLFSESLLKLSNLLSL